MELSELTNKELKYILRQNKVKNYSKLNKKGLLKKVNQLIKEQSGGNTENRTNGSKKIRLRGGEPTPGTNSPLTQNASINTGNIGPPPRNAPGGPNDPERKKKNTAISNPEPSNASSTPRGTNANNLTIKPNSQILGPSAPPLNDNNNSQGAIQKNGPTIYENIPPTQTNGTKSSVENGCGSCSIQ